MVNKRTNQPAAKASAAESVGIVTPLRWKRSSRFVLSWELNERAVEGAGFDVDYAQASATYDFSKGEVLHVMMLPGVITAGVAFPYLDGPKRMMPASAPYGDPCWASHGDRLELLHALDPAWVEKNESQLTVELFDGIVRAITERLPALLEAKLVTYP